MDKNNKVARAYSFNEVVEKLNLNISSSMKGKLLNPKTPIVLQVRDLGKLGAEILRLKDTVSDLEETVSKLTKTKEKKPRGRPKKSK